MTTSEILNAVDPKRMRADVEKLASFLTRNTNSETLHEATAWLASRYNEVTGCEAEVMRYHLEPSRRVPEAIDPSQVIGRRKGSSDRWVMVGGHMDSLNLQVDAKTGRAPGANDDGSGTMVALECMRVLASLKSPVGLMSVGWSGEEQGLLGSRALAERCVKEGTRLEAVLSNDTVGSSSNKNSQKDAKHVRVFSDEPWSRLPKPAEGFDVGPEVNAQSRELARFMEWITRGRIHEFGVKLVFRRDRFGRGGDHTPFHDHGFPAVRLVEVHEEYTRQHTPDDLPEHMDWAYLANVARLNALTLASLMQADPGPKNVKIVRDQSHDTKITWAGEPDVCYTVFWRETTSPVWQDTLNVEANIDATIKKVNKDDYIFGVGSVGGCPMPAT